MEDWYKIPEIRFCDYVESLKGVYDARTANIDVQTDERDAFTKAVMPWRLDDEVWRQREKKITMALGDFHQKLMGKFSGYTNLGTGHVTGLDLMKTDGTEYWEVKNRHNTMNSASAKTTLDKLLVMKEKGSTVFLAQINCPGGKVNRYGYPSDVTVFNGSQAYAYLSGRETFWNDLIYTISETFKLFTTHSEIQRFAAQQPPPISLERHSQSACIEPPSLP